MIKEFSVVDEEITRGAPCTQCVTMSASLTLVIYVHSEESMQSDVRRKVAWDGFMGTWYTFRLFALAVHIRCSSFTKTEVHIDSTSNNAASTRKRLLMTERTASVLDAIIYCSMRLGEYCSRAGGLCSCERSERLKELPMGTKGVTENEPHEKNVERERFSPRRKRTEPKPPQPTPSPGCKDDRDDCEGAFYVCGEYPESAAMCKMTCQLCGEVTALTNKPLEKTTMMPGEISTTRAQEIRTTEGRQSTTMKIEQTTTMKIKEPTTPTTGD
ncbi:unnamed protein product [Toxocara canis]|uniref:ShKT domain-containing protein n=1 Tax=Toxocara canis TaxID=6265 RepID=A0A183V325_TOXCA|nr:unnamed protein product [Toxocara canis]